MQISISISNTFFTPDWNRKHFIYQDRLNNNNIFNDFPQIVEANTTNSLRLDVVHTYHPIRAYIRAVSNNKTSYLRQRIKTVWLFNILRLQSQFLERLMLCEQLWEKFPRSVKLRSYSRHAGKYFYMLGSFIEHGQTIVSNRASWNIFLYERYLRRSPFLSLRRASEKREIPRVQAMRRNFVLSGGAAVPLKALTSALKCAIWAHALYWDYLLSRVFLLLWSNELQASDFREQVWINNKLHTNRSTIKERRGESCFIKISTLYRSLLRSFIDKFSFIWFITVHR